jgi:DNA processing protein
MSSVRLAPGDPAFPARLLQIPSPPVQVWVRGDPGRLPSSSTPSIAIVGSRAATRDGLQTARTLAGDLASAGFVIVSGLARGIDGAAHQAALDAHGCTIAVLGSGLDVVYPPEHAGLASRIAETGAVVSEYAPAFPPLPGAFPRRNRLISGLADAVIIVEAPEKSGTLITASAALDQGKDVLVVPGRVPGARNRGGHLLIRDGARLVETADDVLADLGWLRRPPGAAQGAAPSQELDDPREFPLGEEFSVDEVCARSGETPAAVLSRLLKLEIGGSIQRIGSGRFVRLRGRVLT